MSNKNKHHEPLNKNAFKKKKQNRKPWHRHDIAKLKK